ncbi:MAG TPA: glycosyltransferase family 39 protein, partial [Acidimicrobiales bacterium]|nr:glycosyltransferase family 39 protein [Acidimicrobiales bacterium]
MTTSTLVSPTTDPDEAPASGATVRSRRHPVPLALGIVLAVAANLFALGSGQPRFVGPALALWLILVNPTFLIATTDVWGERSVGERALYGLAGTLLLLLVGGLAINTFLPLVGVARPLDTVPVLVLVDAINVGLWLFRRPRRLFVDWRVRLSPAEARTLALAAVCILLMVLGANRLNNGHGDTLTLVGLGLVLVVMFLLLHWCYRLRTGVISAAVYLLSLALLLMTSLRGWSVTGHDIQLEYRVFQLTAAHGKWDFSLFQDAYNACLSITMLPTQMAALLHIDDPYVFKVVFQMMFAMCPVAVFLLARRYFADRIAILAVVYFVGFPTFFTDMPFLNRQETALLFVAAGILAITDPRWSRQRRRWLLVVAAVGVELSHYSTSYVFLATLCIAWLAESVMALGWPPRWARSNRSETPDRHWSTTSRVLAAACLAVIVAATVVWGGVVTKVAGGVPSEVKAAVS